MAGGKKKKTDAGGLPHCIVVDPRFSSRKEVLENLRSLEMFTSVIEAKSVKHALSLLKDVGSDACVIGPSFTQDSLDEFLEHAHDASSECVFVGISTESSDAPENELLHATLSLESSKEDLTATIVKAFAAVGREIPVAGFKKEKTREPEISEPVPIPEPTPIAAAQKPFSFVDMTTSDPRLQLLWKYAQKHRSLKALPPEERAALDAILDGLTSGIEDKSKAPKFRAHIEHAFQGFGEWSEELSLLEALNELRSTILRTWK